MAARHTHVSRAPPRRLATAARVRELRSRARGSRSTSKQPPPVLTEQPLGPRNTPNHRNHATPVPEAVWQRFPISFVLTTRRGDGGRAKVVEHTSEGRAQEHLHRQPCHLEDPGPRYHHERDREAARARICPRPPRTARTARLGLRRGRSRRTDDVAATTARVNRAASGSPAHDEPSPAHARRV